MYPNPESSDIESSSRHICPNFGFGNFSSLNNFPLSRIVSSLKIDIFLFFIYLVGYQESCYFAAVEVDAQDVSGRIVAWNNRTSSAYSDLSDQVFPGC